MNKFFKHNSIVAAVLLLSFGTAFAQTADDGSLAQGTGSVASAAASDGKYSSGYNSNSLRSVANGKNAKAFGGGVAVGDSALADSLSQTDATGTSIVQGGVAIGGGSTSRGTGSAVGAFSTAEANGVAVGTFANAGQGSVAIGTGSKATSQFGHGSIALGASSVSQGADEVSFGCATGECQYGMAGFTRRLTNISDGISATDAASMGQLNVVSGVANNALVQADNANTNALRAGVIAVDAWDRATAAYSLAAAAQEGVNQLRTDVVANRKIAAQGVASALALQTPSQDVPIGKTAMAIGVGNYDGSSAVGVTWSHAHAFDVRKLTGQDAYVPVLFSVGVAAGSGGAPTATRVGASIVF